MQAAGAKMADGKQDAGTTGSFGGLVRPYRPGQGSTARALAWIVGVGFSLWGVYDLWGWLHGFAALSRPFLEPPLHRVPLTRGLPISGSLAIAAGVVAGAVLLVAWLLKRPWLADLLIDTEGEMKKVTWPGREEAWSATKVVSVTVIVITVVLLVFDMILTQVMRLLTEHAI
ncbi:MAG TPA: preprotein translocase subunit SecE [Planctomycetota bacterium]|nr:preprotein translocase subunit SecE [Planctomycetota bacterium]